MQVVLDSDGTVTEVDGLHLVLLEFGDQAVYEEHEARLGRELTLHEVIAREFRTVSAPLPEVVAWMREHARLRPGFAEFAQEHGPLIVSSGFHELIEPILEREGLGLDVRANRPILARTAGALSSATTNRVPSAGSPASARTSRDSGSSSTPATGSRTGASPSLRRASSPATGWPSTSPARGSRSNPSRTSATSRRASTAPVAARTRLGPWVREQGGRRSQAPAWAAGGALARRDGRRRDRAASRSRTSRTARPARRASDSRRPRRARIPSGRGPASSSSRSPSSR